MKRSACSQFMLISCLLVSILQFHLVIQRKTVHAQEYSLGGQIFTGQSHPDTSIHQTNNYNGPIEHENIDQYTKVQQRILQQNHHDQQQHKELYNNQKHSQHQQLHHNNHFHEIYSGSHSYPNHYLHGQDHIEQPQHAQMHDDLRAQHVLRSQIQQSNSPRYQQQHQRQMRAQTHRNDQAESQASDDLPPDAMSADGMQQAMFDPRKREFHHAHTQVELRHESTVMSEMSGFLVNIESTYNSMFIHEEPIYQQIDQQTAQMTYVEQERLIYTSHINDGQKFEFAQHHGHYYTGHPDESCGLTNDPSTPPANVVDKPTCQATPSVWGKLRPDDPSGSAPNFSPYNNKPSRNSNVESYPLTQHYYTYESSLMAAIKHYWREVSGLCLASAIFLNWLFVVVKRRLISSGLTSSENSIQAVQQFAPNTSVSTKSVSKDTNSNTAHDSAFEENASPMSLDDVDTTQSSSLDRDKSGLSGRGTMAADHTPVTRLRSSTLKTEPIQIPTSPRGHNSVSGSLSNSLSNNSEYISRYCSDFDSIRRLGRGGFGIVFEARNKIDDCNYAVKRICLPLEREARERVMREVRALAKLDHAGIVRYYNAWLETPPDEWLKQHDAQLGIVHSKDGMSFPSTDGIYERNESEQQTRGKFGESGDSSEMLATGNLRRRKNIHQKFLRKNSSSPSLDIVFEGSGSLRLESENNSNDIGDSLLNQHGHLKAPEDQNRSGDNNSDSEDSDFINFESRVNNTNAYGGDGDNESIGHLTEPFSSDSESCAPVHGGRKDREKNNYTTVEEARRRALAYQREMRQSNRNSSTENLQVEKVYLYIQMQLCRKDTLRDWLKTNCENRDKTTIFDLFYQIVDAVEYVHSQDLIHRDLKPSNIFFSLDGTLKIGDFGLCRTKTNSSVGSSLDLQEHVAESEVERGFEAVHTEQVGTQLYMSPEQLNGLSYNQKVDIFAMGLILLELIIPFKTQMHRLNVLFKARNNLFSEEFKREHSKEHELVRSLLTRCPLKRPTATEIKQHELLASAQLSQPVIERIYHRRRTISSNSSTE